MVDNEQTSKTTAADRKFELFTVDIANRLSLVIIDDNRVVCRICQGSTVRGDVNVITCIRKVNQTTIVVRDHVEFGKR